MGYVVGGLGVLGLIAFGIWKMRVDYKKFKKRESIGECTPKSP